MRACRGLAIDHAKEGRDREERTSVYELEVCSGDKVGLLLRGYLSFESMATIGTGSHSSQTVQAADKDLRLAHNDGKVFYGERERKNKKGLLRVCSESRCRLLANKVVDHAFLCVFACVFVLAQRNEVCDYDQKKVVMSNDSYNSPFFKKEGMAFEEGEKTKPYVLSPRTKTVREVRRVH